MSFVNWRYNQFEGTYVPSLITDEPHTITFHTDWNAYGIQLSEVPQKATPSNLSIEESGTGTPTTFTEVPFNQAPGAGEFRVDYETTNQFGTGRIQFNGADDGKQVLVTYYGLGSIVSPDNFATVLADETIPGSLTLTNDLSVGDDATITGDLSVTATSTFTGGFKTEGSDLFRVKKIDIGPWDMDTDPGVSIVIGLTDAQCSKIVEMQAIVFDDSGKRIRRISTVYDATGLASGNITVFLDPFAGGPDAVASITRVTGGIFDSTDYNDAVINRGYIFIVYMV